MKLIEQFFEKYTTKEETKYRLPKEIDVEEFWVEELSYRQSKAKKLPLSSDDGKNYYCNTSACFDLISLERDITSEAMYSSAIEGARITQGKLQSLLESEENPIDENEQMVLNNYRALEFAVSNIDTPFSHELILKISELLTGISDYRNDSVYVSSKYGKVIYEAPDAEYVGPMMEQLISYMNSCETDVFEKAAVTHLYFVTVHPFFDGNGRTARILSYMIFLKAGFNIPISEDIFRKRGQYYKAIAACQNRENGFDFTYFLNFYAEVLKEAMKN